MRKLTEFQFYKNTPLTNFQNTILFTSNSERDSHFWNKSHYEKLTFHDMPFNFIRDKSTIEVPIPYSLFQGVNYCSFRHGFDGGQVFYAYVINYEYVNDKNTRVFLLIDGIMTYCQGNVINNFKNLSVQRTHLSRSEYNNRLDELKNNDDVIKTHTKHYTDEDKYLFKEFDVLIQSSADFSVDFGDVDDPKVETSRGIKFDKISSPLNLYVVKQNQFNNLMKALAPYPWISQNIRSVSLVPSILLENKTESVPMKSGNFKELYELRDGGTTTINQLASDLLKISKDINDLYIIFGLDSEEDKHLLRNEYTTTEVYTFDGQQLFVDNGLLSMKYGLFFRVAYVSGYHNEVGIYIDSYKSKDDLQGSFLNDAIFFRNFDDIPIMIDNYNLSLSKNANRRQLAESRLVSNRIDSVFDKSVDLKDRFYNASSLMSNFSPFNLFGKFQDEHEFYQNQQAEMKDLALETPTITNQSNNNSLAISNDYYGIHVKFSQPTISEWEKIKKYYKMFGFEVNDENASVNVHTNTICNYVKFTGDFMIPNADIGIVEMLKAQFENGVRFWHNNDTPNPMEQNVLLNKMR